MNRFSVTVLCIWVGFSSPAVAVSGDCSDRLDAPKVQENSRPVLVLIETDPWAMVLGSDSPRFALYGDGLAIYRAKDGFRQIHLDIQRAGELRKAVNVGALACLNKHYSTANVTNQPTEFLFFGRGGRLSSVSVYGSIDRREQNGLPPSLVTAYERLATLADSKAREWMPEFIEVIIWPYEYAPEPSIVWPSNWPGLDDAKTVKRRDAYSLYLPSQNYQKLLAFLKTRHEKGAVQIGGKKWAVSFRFPFPQESSWQFKVDDPE